MTTQFLPRYCRLYVIAYPMDGDRFEVVCAKCGFKEYGARSLSVFALNTIQTRHDTHQLPL